MAEFQSEIGVADITAGDQVVSHLIRLGDIDGNDRFQRVSVFILRLCPDHLRPYARDLPEIHLDRIIRDTFALGLFLEFHAAPPGDLVMPPGLLELFRIDLPFVFHFPGKLQIKLVQAYAEPGPIDDVAHQPEKPAQRFPRVKCQPAQKSVAASRLFPGGDLDGLEIESLRRLHIIFHLLKIHRFFGAFFPPSRRFDDHIRGELRIGFHDLIYQLIRDIIGDDIDDFFGIIFFVDLFFLLFRVFNLFRVRFFLFFVKTLQRVLIDNIVRTVQIH